MAEKSNLPLAIILLSITVTACGPRRVTLPAGPGTPAADFAQVYTAARGTCALVETLQTELGLSGRVAGQRIRGRVHAGLAPGALRLEGVAPFGSPVFILVAEGSQGTLLLLRDRRVLRNAAPEEILNALVGLRLGPNDLRALLSGCVKWSADAAAGEMRGAEWMAVTLVSGETVYLHRDNGEWRIVAGRYAGLEIDYTAFEDGRPSQIVLRGADLALTLDLNQVDVNTELPRDRLIAVTIPSGLSPLTLEELRSAGPLGR